jgi:hypothetical protein
MHKLHRQIELLQVLTSPIEIHYQRVPNTLKNGLFAHRIHDIFPLLQPSFEGFFNSQRAPTLFILSQFHNSVVAKANYSSKIQSVSSEFAPGN